MPRDPESSDYLTKRFRNPVRDAIDKGALRAGWLRVMQDDGTWRWRRIKTPPPSPKPPDSPDGETPPPSEKPPIPEGLFGRVKHDIEVPPRLPRPLLVVTDEEIQQALDEGRIPPRRLGGYPETVKAVDSDWVPLNREWQFYWFNLLQMTAAAQGFEESVVNLFRVITRSIAFKTNQHGAENGYANYVTGQNLGAKAMRTEVIVTGGAYLLILDGGAKYSFRGHTCYRFATLDYRKAVPRAEFHNVQTPYVYFATTSRIDRQVIPLMGSIDIPVPNVGLKDWHLIECDRVEILPEGASVPDPYIRS